MAAHKKIDWERLEPDWRAGIKSVLQMAADYEEKTKVKISHTAINKHFKELNIPRDLKEKINAKANAIVSASKVSGKVSIETNAKDADIINSSALELANVQLSQRRDIGRSRTLAMKLFDELEFATDNLELLEQLGELMHAPDEKGVDKLNELYHKVISLPQRSQTMKALADTLKTLITLEREAFGIADKTDNSINITNTVQTAISGFDLKRLTDEELDFYMALQQKIEVTETNLIEQK